MTRLHAALLFALISIVTPLHAVNVPPTATEYGYVDSDGGLPPGGGINATDRAPVYEWVSLAQSGALVIQSGDDVSSQTPRGQGGIGATVQLGRPFPLFGFYHETLTPTSNGYLSSAKREDGSDNTPDCPIPPRDPRWQGGARIAPFHCDLDLGVDGEVRYRYFEKSPHPFRKCGVSVFSWDNVTIKASGLEISFQALLFDTGDVLFQYSTPTGDQDILGAYSVGIHNANARSSVAYQCAEFGTTDDVFNLHAVRFEPYEIFVENPIELAQAVQDIPVGGKIRFSSSTQFGGGFDNLDMSVLGGPVVIDKSLAIDGGRGFTVRRSSPRRLSGAFKNGLFRIGPGARVLITECELIEGNAVDGGAILNDGGNLKLSCVSLREHRASGRGGAVASIGASAELVMSFCNVLLNESGGSGGAVFAEGAVKLHGTTLFSNEAGKPDVFAGGGGLFLGNAQAALSNCTVSNNLVHGGGVGLYIDGGSAALSHCTVFGNRGERTTYGIFSLGGQLTLDHCIVAENPGNFKSAGGGTATSGGNNVEDLDEFGFSGASDLANTDPDLTPIGLHGGTVLTHLPRAASPAIDAGAIASLATIPTTDARGFPRVVDSDSNGSERRDLGAVEAGERFVVNMPSGRTEINIPAGMTPLMNAVRDAPDGAHIVFDQVLSGVAIDLETLDGTYEEPKLRHFDIDQSFLFFDGSLTADPVHLRQITINGQLGALIYTVFAKEGMVSIDSVKFSGRALTPMLNLYNSPSPEFSLRTELLMADECELEKLVTGSAWLRDLDVGFGSGGTVAIDDTALTGDSSMGGGPAADRELSLTMPDILQIDGVRSTSISVIRAARSNANRVNIRRCEFAGSEDIGVETSTSFRETVIEDVVCRDHGGRGLYAGGSFVTIERCSILHNQGGGLFVRAHDAVVRHSTISGNQLTVPFGFQHPFNNGAPAGGDPKYQWGGAAVEYLVGEGSMSDFDGSMRFEFCTIYDNTYHSSRQLDDCLGHDDPDVDGICNHSTSPDRATGGILFSSAYEATIRNCIIARNRVVFEIIPELEDYPQTRPFLDNFGYVSPLVPYEPDHDPDESASVESLGGNLLDTDELDLYGITAAGDQQDTDPRLGPLFDHGGRAPSHMPLAISPAIDAALGTPANHLTDVRDRDRTTDGDADGSIVADIGAVEADSPLVVTTAADQDNGPSGGVSLREAIAGAGEHGRIIFSRFINGQSIILGTPSGGQGRPIEIMGSVMIDGTSIPQGVTIDGARSSRSLDIYPDLSVAIHAVSFTNGRESGEDGGAIANAADLLLTRSLVSNNTCSGRGGGIWNGPGSLQLHNVTLTGNAAATGSAIANHPLASGEISIRQCTIANNEATNGAGLQFDNAATEVSFASTIVAGNLNSDNDVVKNVTGSASFTSLGYNLTDVGGLQAGHPFDIDDTPALLASRPSDEGGFCQVLVPLQGSPAIDGGWYPYGPPNLSSNRDARGAQRQLGHFGRRLDIGAYERYSIDSDGDKLPDAWEEEQALDPNDPSDALVDGDCDGEDHLTEFLNGNDPWENYGRLCDHRPAPVWNLGPGSNTVTFDFPSLTPPTQPTLRLGVQMEISEDLKRWSPYRPATPSGLGVPAGPETLPLSSPRPSNPRIFYRGRYILDLSGADLDGVVLSGVDLSGLDLSGADFGGADLSEADFSGANLSDVSFEGSDLTGALFTGALSLVLDEFLGAPADPIETSLPAFLPFVLPEDFSLGHPDTPDDPVSHNTIVVMFQDGTSVSQANDLLATHGLRISGAIPADAPGGSAIFSLRAPTTDHAGFAPLFGQVMTDPIVLYAAPNIPGQLDVLPSRTGRHPDWSDWGDFGVFDQPDDKGGIKGGGTWGMRYIRAPQLWNFNESIDKHRFIEGPENRTTRIGVVDAGIKRNHPDLAQLPIRIRTRGAADILFLPDSDGVSHGVHVTGTIAAPHGNGGVDGVTPYGSIFFVSGNAATNSPRDVLSILGAMLVDFSSSAAAGVRVINVSMGYKNNLWIPVYGEMFAKKWVEKPRPLVASSAGNRHGRPAIFNSPQNFAAINLEVPGIFVVENLSHTMLLSSGSDRQGNISAPGTDILSCAQELQPDGSVLDYDSFSGTSMAAPHVTGTIAYLLSLDPTLTNAQVQELLTLNRNALGTGNGLDAWAAAMDIDRAQGSDAVLRMLLDIDDGTPDGNQRLSYRVDTDADEPAEDPTVPITALYLEEDVDLDAGIGDGRIDMSDYRRARDWAHIASDTVQPQGMDGPPDHPKLDANRDGTIDLPNEWDYPRNDFNGDGEGEVEEKHAQVPGAFGGRLGTDIEVLANLFDDPHYTGTEIINLGYDTADLQLSLYWLAVADRDEGTGFTDAVVTIRNTGAPVFFEKVINVVVPDEPDVEHIDLVLSVPLETEFEIEVCAASAEESTYGETIFLTPLDACEDHYFSPRAFLKVPVGP